MFISQSYVDCVEAMMEAARQWIATHPFAGPLQFNDLEGDVAQRVGKRSEGIGIIATLADIAPRWAANADTLSFLQAMVSASHGQATYLQARFIIHEAFKRMLERGSGKLPTPWACVACGAMLSGYTNLRGEPGPPGPGAWTVCSECGELLRVRATGDGYERPSTQAFNRLPKEIRRKLLACKALTREHKARKEQAS